MFLPATLFIGALGYLFYSTKKEVLLDTDAPSENSIDNENLFKDLEDLFI